MTNDGWSNKWPSNWKTNPSKPIKVIEQTWPDYSLDKGDWPKAPELTGLDLGAGERVILTTFENDSIKHKVISQTELKSQGSNLVDHEQHLYFQCDNCGEILDPNTKSFRALQEHRVNAGWKCIWNIDGMGYKVYCAKCGEKVK